MRKYICIIAFILLFTLSACANDDVESENNTAGEQSSDVTNELVGMETSQPEPLFDEPAIGDQLTVDNDQKDTSQPYETHSPSYYWPDEKIEIIKKMQGAPQRFEIPRIPGNRRID